MRTRAGAWAVIGAAFGIALPFAPAQIAPEREYSGVRRPLPVTVGSGEDTDESSGAGVNQIRLLGPDGSEVARAACRPGKVDLAALFPRLWTDEPARVVYAQAYRGDEPVGPALVLQPLVNPAYAPRVDRDGAPAFVTPAGRGRVLSGYRAYVDKDIVIETSKGALRIALRPEAAPNTAWAVRGLVGGGFYTDILVHRVASLGGQAEPDVIQFGDPSVRVEAGPEESAGAAPSKNGDTKPDAAASKGAKRSQVVSAGIGGAGMLIDLEPSPLRHDFGVLSMARGNDPNSASSQIVIALNRGRCAVMDGRYTGFAEVVEGGATLAALAHTPVDADYRTIDPPVIRSARLVDAAPFPKKPGRVADPGTRPVER